MTTRHFVFRSTVLGVLIAGLLAVPAASIVRAQSIVSSTIDGTGPGVTPPGWDGFAGHSYWGPYPASAVPSFGQTFTTPATANALESVTFQIHTNSDLGHVGITYFYRAFLYEWDGVGLVGGPLFTSPVLTMTTQIYYQTISVDTGNTAVTPGQQYVVFLSHLGVSPPDSFNFEKATWGGMQLANANAYSGGGFVFSMNNVTWSTLGGNDSAFALTFSTATPTNTPPSADAGDNQFARPGLTVQLNGSGSFDDNTPTIQLQYDWSFVSVPAGSTVALGNATTMTPNFTPDISGTYVVQLVVADQGALSSAPSQVTIGENPPPTANAGADKLVIVGTTVTLSGSGADPDGDPITYAWALTGIPTASTAQLYNATLSETSFVADRPGVYSAHLTVSDPLGPGDPDAVQITATTASGYAQLLIQEAGARILSLTADAVTNRGNQNALTRFLSNAIVALQAADVAEARQQIEKAILRTDGCAVGGTPDGNGPSRDWITTCDGQNQVYPALADALAVIAP